MNKKLVVIGGGAAGFFCAVNAARMNPHLKVIIAEKTNKLLTKVKVSGGGRCNVTHACFDISVMSKRYPRGLNFVKKTFHQFFTSDTIKWFEERGIKLKTEADGRMFPVSNTSRTIIDCLLKEANKYGVEILLNVEVNEIKIPNIKSEIRNDYNFRVCFTNSGFIDSDFICIACGGYPKESMFNWIRQLNHTIEEPVPSLFTFNMPGHALTKLMGVSVEKTKVKIYGSMLQETGPILITHWGLSGPAVLRLSAWGARELRNRNYEFKLIINWMGDLSEQIVKERLLHLRFALGPQRISNKNPYGLPQRLWEFLLQDANINMEIRWADLSKSDENKLIKKLVAFEAGIKGKTTFKEEFVTAGGINLKEVDANTMMSKKVPNLFLAGEIIDVDGITGGYNFQHAWTSGWIAAKNIAALSSEVKSEM